MSIFREVVLPVVVVCNSVIASQSHGSDATSDAVSLRYLSLRSCCSWKPLAAFAALRSNGVPSSHGHRTLSQQHRRIGSVAKLSSRSRSILQSPSLSSAGHRGCALTTPEDVFVDRCEQKRGFFKLRSREAVKLPCSGVVLCWQEGFVSPLGGGALCWTSDGLAFDRCLVAGGA